MPAGGLAADGQRWVAGSEKYLLAIRVLAPVFRGKFLAGLKQLYEEGRLSLSGGAELLRDPFEFGNLLHRLYRKSWWVYSKPPFGGPEQVLKYLARYTHRVALSNHRLVALADGRVTFTYKDYSQGGRRRELVLPAEEFIRRFLLHVLPHRFVRIRHYGFFANRHRVRNLERVRQLLGAECPESEPAQSGEWQAVFQRVTGRDPTLCPECGSGHLRRVRALAPLAGRAPP